ncbi:cell division protein FtsQ/DivIB [Lactobacillus selangorensis]|nr:FtsQ-type POTRA domain-containing protein [Lactobacillus selangorensis]
MAKHPRASHANEQRDPAEALTPWERYQQRQKKEQERAKKHQTRRKQFSKELPHLTKQRHHQLKWHLIILLGVFSLLLIGLIYGVSPWSHVDHVEVTGAQTVSRQEIVSASGLNKKKMVLPAWQNQKEMIAKLKQKYPQIKKVAFSVSLPNTVRLQVTEYATIGSFKVKQDQYRPLLENGRILATPQTSPLKNVPVYLNFKSGKLLTRTITGVLKIPRGVQNEIASIQLTHNNINPYQIYLYMDDGTQVIADIRTFSRKMAYYETIRKQMKKKGRIDLEIGAFSESAS